MAFTQPDRPMIKPSVCCPDTEPNCVHGQGTEYLGFRSAMDCTPSNSMYSVLSRHSEISNYIFRKLFRNSKKKIFRNELIRVIIRNLKYEVNSILRKSSENYNFRRKSEKFRSALRAERLKLLAVENVHNPLAHFRFEVDHFEINS